jgi:hypothetical protein
MACVSDRRKGGEPQKIREFRVCRRVSASTENEVSVAPVWRHRFEAQRAAFEHGLQLVDAAIALSQALRSAEGVG